MMHASVMLVGVGSLRKQIKEPHTARNVVLRVLPKITHSSSPSLRPEDHVPPPGHEGVPRWSQNVP